MCESLTVGIYLFLRHMGEKDVSKVLVAVEHVDSKFVFSFFFSEGIPSFSTNLHTELCLGLVLNHFTQKPLRLPGSVASVAHYPTATRKAKQTAQLRVWPRPLHTWKHLTMVTLPQTQQLP